MTRPRILVVEDDPTVAGLVVRGLDRAGFEVVLAASGEAALREAERGPLALALVDLMLPGKDGFEVLTALRARHDVPVVVVTARLALEDRLRAFELGAIDYLPKPFFFEELLARIQVRLALEPAAAVIDTGLLRLDLAARVVEVAGAPVKLTPTELAVLRYLAERPGRAVSRADLATALVDADDGNPENVEAHVSRLRRKLGAASVHLKTVWGHGYRFEMERGERA
jgi:DNA-binding response OmpR family regulator